MGKGDPVSGKHRWSYALLGLFFLAVCVLTMARSGHVVWIVTIAAIFMFASKRRTLAVYGVAVAGYLSLVVFAEWFMVKLPVWDATLAKGTPLMEQATRIQTFTDRLRSYQELKNWDNYTFFGVDRYVFAHDPITETLVHYGAIPLFLMLAIAVGCLYRLHQWVLRFPVGSYRRLACLLLGAGLGIVAGSVVFGGYAGVFPVNAFQWILFGALVSLIFEQKVRERESMTASLSANPPDPALPGHRPMPFPAPGS
jgi:hypothetical protein